MPLSDIEIAVVGCNLGACTSLPPSSSPSSSPSLAISVCEGGGGEVVEEGMRGVERLLEEERLEEALHVLLAISDIDNCTQVEVLF